MSARIRWHKGFFLSVLFLELFLISQVPIQAVQKDITEIRQDVDSINSLLEAANFTQADASLANLLVDYTYPEDRAMLLGELAKKYERYNLERSKQLAREVTNQYSETETANEMRFILDRYAIENLIDSGDITAAQTALNQFQINHANQNRLDKYVYRLAQRYAGKGYPCEASAACAQFAENFTDSHYAQDAQLRSAQYSIYESLVANNLNAANSALSQLRSTFADHADLLEVLNEITVQYLDRGEYEAVVSMCEDYRIAYPSNDEQLQVLMNLVSAKTYLQDDAGVRSTMEQMIEEFPQEGKKLTNALFFVGDHYRSCCNYKQEMRLYHYISSKWMSNEPTFWQQWTYVYSQIATGSKNKIDEEIEKLISEYPPEKSMARYFYWLGDLCHRMGDDEKACRFYQVVIDRWPTDGWTLSCRFTHILIDPALNETERETAINQFTSDYSSNKDYIVAVFRTTSSLYRNGIQKRQGGMIKGSFQDLNNVLISSALINGDVYNKADLFVRQELPGLQAYSYSKFGQDTEAIAICNQFSEKWPNHPNLYYFQKIRASCYSRMLRKELVEIEEIEQINQIVEGDLQAVIEHAKQPSIRLMAMYDLGKFYSRNNLWTQAISTLEALVEDPNINGNLVNNAIYALNQAYQKLGQETHARAVYEASHPQ